MASISQRELLIPWSQAQQLRLAAVFDTLLDGDSLASPAANRSDRPNFGSEVPAKPLHETLWRVCSDHRVLAIAACVVAQDLATQDASEAISVFPASIVTSGPVLPVESRHLRRIVRAWLLALRQVLIGVEQVHEPEHDAFNEWIDPDGLVDLPPAAEFHSLNTDASSRLTHMWEQCRSLIRRPTHVALLVSGGDLADPRYRSLQVGLLRRLELILLQCTMDDRVEQEKLASLKRLAYGASHEINNPLANIATRAQTLMREESNLQRRQVLEMINAQAFRAFDMLANLMHYAAPPLAKLQTTDLVTLARRCLSEIQSHGEDTREPQWNGSCDPIEALVDAQQVAVMVQALLRNAREACGPQGTIGVTVEEISAGEYTSGWVAIRVADNGPAVPRESLAVMCDPFHSGREAGRGLGFGLAKSLRIVEAHQGWLAFEPEDPQGLRVTAFLPMVPAFGTPVA
ncbi:MAG: HAMP domain-containing sensor histidine kinase [Pirellulaceae bacterium]|nr:HAMP domain-containing sensor histidine kinase [Pirellulaceae bacterium]